MRSRAAGSGAGPFLYTLSMVDVATGWVVCAGLRDKRQETVFHALQRLQADLPFRILGLDSDNGKEFINRPCWTTAPTTASPSPARGRTSRTTPVTLNRRTG